MTTKIQILGMNRISVSLGMAMKKSGDLIERSGFDPNNSYTKRAIDRGALDRMAMSITDGVKNADIIIYAFPSGQLLDVAKTIQKESKPGCVFININPIGHDTFNQLSQILPDPDSIIAWVPALNPKYMQDQDLGPESAHEDLFHNSHVYITGEINTRPAVLSAGSDLAILAGALPLFIDSDELAGISALGQDFPRLMAMTITRLLTSETGWNEARKIAGFDFDFMSTPLTSFENQGNPEIPLYMNRKHLQRLIVLTIQELRELHDSLDVIDNRELGGTIKNTILARQLWKKQRLEMSWLEKRPIDPNAPHSVTELMFGKRRKKS